MLFGMSRTRPFIPLLIAFALLPLPLCVQAQTVAAQDAVRAVNEISLLVVVKGRAGEAVEGLSASDFAVEADGRKQLVSSVVREADSPLLVGLVANTGTEQRKALADERKAAMEFVKSLREGRDRAFVMRFSREVELLQDVTTSHERLLKGVDAISVGEQHSVGSGGERRRGETSPGGGILLGGNTLYDAIFLASDEVMKTRTGRKVLLVFSDGVDRESRSSLSAAMESAQRGNVVVYTVYVPLEDSLNHNGLLPAGLGGDSVESGSAISKQDRAEGKKVLQQIARETGGRCFELSKKEINKKESTKKSPLDDIYKELAVELHHQYTLRFVPSTSEGGYHRVKVTMRNTGLTVQARDGYYTIER